MNILGKYLPLKIIRITESGAYLMAGHDELELPPTQLPEGVKEGDNISVFIYKDQTDKLCATTKKPLALVNEAAYLTVKDNSNVGSFMDWGLVRDLLVPFREQKDQMKVGKDYLVYVYIDEETDRIAGSTRMNKFISNNEVKLSEGQEVEILVCDQTDLGYNVIIENKYWGLIYKNEVFRNISRGEKTKAYVKKIRAENKIDISLQKQGYDEVSSASDQIMDKLVKNQGFLSLNDKSDPKDIYKELQMSKKTFKKATGWLFRNRKIEITDEGLKLISED